MLNISLLKKTTRLLSYMQRIWVGQWGKVYDIENVSAGQNLLKGKESVRPDKRK
jgi:hypothetical protein